MVPRDRDRDSLLSVAYVARESGALDPAVVRVRFHCESARAPQAAIAAQLSLIVIDAHREARRLTPRGSVEGSVVPVPSDEPVPLRQQANRDVRGQVLAFNQKG